MVTASEMNQPCLSLHCGTNDTSTLKSSAPLSPRAGLRENSRMRRAPETGGLEPGSATFNPNALGDLGRSRYSCTCNREL